jgi:hypothetical protein
MAEPEAQDPAAQDPAAQDPAAQGPREQDPAAEAGAAASPAAQSSTAESPTEPLADLLLKAVRMLPADEQDGVFRMLLDRHATTLPPRPEPPHAGIRGPWPPALTEAGWTLSRTVERGSGTLRMVPVRLSAEQHDELKQWCEANDFSMAVVIRGLVDRFLSSQQRPHPSH